MRTRRLLGPALVISEGSDEFAFDEGAGGQRLAAPEEDSPTPVRPGRTSVDALVTVVFGIS